MYYDIFLCCVTILWLSVAVGSFAYFHDNDPAFEIGMIVLSLLAAFIWPVWLPGVVMYKFMRR